MRKKKKTLAEYGQIGGVERFRRLSEAEKLEYVSQNGSVSSPRKTRAAKKNGQKGGRPGNPEIKRIMQERGISRQRAWVIYRSKA
ncbi:MAG TPA: hypothetical protein VHA06_07740 [Candidatus Angelobacter sp.]|jgi:hypothetical protein|nr:hypothetical protein [Candidatus Angelobacter sp.]